MQSPEVCSDVLGCLKKRFLDTDPCLKISACLEGMVSLVFFLFFMALFTTFKQDRPNSLSLIAHSQRCTQQEKNETIEKGQKDNP